jgi:hypothetical protein
LGLWVRGLVEAGNLDLFDRGFASEGPSVLVQGVEAEEVTEGVTEPSYFEGVLTTSGHAALYTAAVS